MGTTVPLVGTDRKDSTSAIIKIYSYENKTPVGTCYFLNAGKEKSFINLTQMLMSIEEILKEYEMSYVKNDTKIGKIGKSTSRSVRDNKIVFKSGENGKETREPIASFIITIVFRNMDSWQGMISWSNKNVEQYFRSALEMLFLMDEALTSELNRQIS